MILVIGYGNSLRSRSDAVGRQVAESLPSGQNDLEVLSLHQLGPELAEPISKSQGVIFIDACEGPNHGAVRCETVSAGPASPPACPRSQALRTSQLRTAPLRSVSPPQLLSRSYAVPLPFGTELTRPVQNALPDAIQAVMEIVHEWTISSRPASPSFGC